MAILKNEEQLKHSPCWSLQPCISTSSCPCSSPAQRKPQAAKTLLIFSVTPAHRWIFFWAGHGKSKAWQRSSLWLLPALGGVWSRRFWSSQCVCEHRSPPGSVGAGAQLHTWGSEPCLQHRVKWDRAETAVASSYTARKPSLLWQYQAHRWSPGALSVLGSARGSVASACPTSELSRKRKLMDWTVKQPYSTLKASFHHVRGSFGPILIWLVYLQQSICFNLQLMLQRLESWVRNFPCFPPKMSKVNEKQKQKKTKHRQMDLLLGLKIHCAKSKNVSLLSPLGLQCLVVL